MASKKSDLRKPRSSQPKKKQLPKSQDSQATGGSSRDGQTEGEEMKHPDYFAEYFPPLVHAIKACITETGLNTIDVGNLGLETAQMKTIFNLLPDSQVTEFKAENSNLQWGMPDFIKELEHSKVNKLSFRGCQLRVLDILVLMEALKNTQVTNLDLTQVSFSEAYLESSAKALFEHIINSKLTHLRLTGSSLLTSQGGHYLASVLPQTSISHLWIDQTGIGSIEGHSTGTPLFELFTNLPKTSLTELYLCCNDIEDEHLRPLIETLRWSKLEKLYLSENKISDIGVTILSRALVFSKLKELNLTKNDSVGTNILGSCLKDSYLSVLHFAQNTICDYAMFSLPDFLKNTSLTELNLHQCNLADKMGQDLMKCLKSSKVTKITLSKNYLGSPTVSEFTNIIKETEIKEVDFSENNFSAETMLILSGGIKGSKLERLVLRGGFTRTQQGSLVAEFFDGVKGSALKFLDISHSYFEKNSAILATSLPNTPLTHLDLSYCLIGMNVVVLANTLKDTLITHLKLCGNKIDNNGAQRLGKALGETKILDLQITDNMISDKGAEALTCALKSGPLYRLNLENNKITDEGIQALATMLSGTFITDLQVSSDPDRKILPLVTVLWDNRTRVRKLVPFFKSIAPSSISANGEGDFTFDSIILRDNEDLIKFVEEALLSYKFVVDEPSAIGALAEAAPHLSRDQVAVMLKLFPRQFMFFVFGKTKKELAVFIEILGKAKALELNTIVEFFLRSLGALIVKNKDGIAYPDVYKLMQEHKEALCNLRLRPEEKEIVAQYFIERPPCCGLCSKSRNLVKTDCCNTWICDDEYKYKLGSFLRVSCIRNHRKYTICHHHWENQHPGKWQNCKICRKEFNIEHYVDYATNDYNFTKLKNPPKINVVCCICRFQSGSLQDFGCQVTQNGRVKFYCAKAECQGKALLNRDTKNSGSSDFFSGIPMLQPLRHYNDKAIHNVEVYKSLEGKGGGICLQR
nr:PREDICTED: uncharacterized protein LOC109033235 [Bemisia tabaci]